MRLCGAVVTLTLFAALFAPEPFARLKMADAAVSYGGGDGASFATSIIVNDAKNEEEGIIAEHAYVTRFHPDWREQDTAIVRNQSRYYDKNTYGSEDGSEHTLIFDVTDFFGKF